MNIHGSHGFYQNHSICHLANSHLSSLCKHAIGGTMKFVMLNALPVAVRFNTCERHVMPLVSYMKQKPHQIERGCSGFQGRKTQRFAKKIVHLHLSNWLVVLEKNPTEPKLLPPWKKKNTSPENWWLVGRWNLLLTWSPETCWLSGGCILLLYVLTISVKPETMFKTLCDIPWNPGGLVGILMAACQNLKTTI